MKTTITTLSLLVALAAAIPSTIAPQADTTLLATRQLPGLGSEITTYEACDPGAWYCATHEIYVCGPSPDGSGAYVKLYSNQRCPDGSHCSMSPGSSTPLCVLG